MLAMWSVPCFVLRVKRLLHQPGTPMYTHSMRSLSIEKMLMLLYFHMYTGGISCCSATYKCKEMDPHTDYRWAYNSMVVSVHLVVDCVWCVFIRGPCEGSWQALITLQGERTHVLFKWSELIWAITSHIRVLTESTNCISGGRHLTCCQQLQENGVEICCQPLQENGVEIYM